MNYLEMTGPDEAIWALLSESAGMPAGTLSNLMGDAPGDTVREALVTAVIDGSLGAFSFGGCLPMPEELRGGSSPFRGSEEKRARLIESYGAEDWYEWAVQKWGTKWDVGEVVVDIVGRGFVGISFETAWGPPQRWAELVSVRHPEVRLHLEYYEPGVAAEGWVDYLAGESIAEGPVVSWAQSMRLAGEYTEREDDDSASGST